MDYLGSLIVERTLYGHNVVLKGKTLRVLRQVIQIGNITRMNERTLDLRLVVTVIVAVHRLLTDHRLQVLLPVGKRGQGVGGRSEEAHTHGGFQDGRDHTSEHEIEYERR